MSRREYETRAAVHPARERERVLDAIRAALRPRPEAPAAAAAPADALCALPAPGDAALRRFLAECAANCTEVILVRSPAEADTALAQILAPVEGGFYAQDAPELRRLLAPWAGRTLWSNAGACDAERAAGLTLAEALIAQTGSIVVSAACGGRAGSVLPDLHIVVARASQLAPSLAATLSALGPAFERASMACVITGPSRTADIEKLLVLGAHGPRRLVLLLRLDA